MQCPMHFELYLRMGLRFVHNSLGERYMNPLTVQPSEVSVDLPHNMSEIEAQFTVTVCIIAHFIDIGY